MKKISRPLTTVNDIDIFTGKKLDLSKEREEQAKKEFEKFLQVRARIRKTLKDGKMFVEGLGRVPAF